MFCPVSKYVKVEKSRLREPHEVNVARHELYSLWQLELVLRVKDTRIKTLKGDVKVMYNFVPKLCFLIVQKYTKLLLLCFMMVDL